MELQRIGQALDLYIRPQTFPVAIRMVSSTDEIPEKARMPKRDLGTLMAVCQGIALAQRYGWRVAMGKEDMLCTLGAFTLGFLPAKAKFLDGSFTLPTWVKNQDVRAKILRSLPQLEPGRYTHLVVAPLNRAEFEPQVIVISGNPAQIGRLIQAVVCRTGEPLISSSLGGISCSGEITRTILTNQCQFIVVGGGCRQFAAIQDHEASFAIPMSQVEALVEGLEETHKLGMRYPTPSYLTFEAKLPPAFGELMDYLKQDG